MYKNDQILRRFSEAFKLKILAELSTCKYSKRELSRLYGVNTRAINSSGFTVLLLSSRKENSSSLDK